MIICLDYGDRYVGVAATDIDEKITYRYSVIDQKKEDVFLQLQEIFSREKPRICLVGLPVNLAGERTYQTEKTSQFITELRERCGKQFPIEEIDETLTSVEAMKIITFEGGKKHMEHAEAARIMLDDYLRSRS